MQGCEMAAVHDKKSPTILTPSVCPELPTQKLRAQGRGSGFESNPKSLKIKRTKNDATKRKKKSPKNTCLKFKRMTSQHYHGYVKDGQLITQEKLDRKDCTR